MRSSFSRGWAAGLRVAVLRAGSVETLGETAFFEELSLQGFELAVEEVVGLVDQAEHRISRDLRRGPLHIGLIGRIGPIGLIRQLPNRLGLRMLLRPDRQAALAEEIFVVFEKFLEAAASDAGQLEFRLL